MKLILFRPFDLSKWFALGFSAFLAELLGNGAGYPNTFKNKVDLQNYDVHNAVSSAYNWMVQHPWWLGVIATGILLGITLLVLFGWLSSRGKFMFLDNVVHNRSEVSRPWHEYKREGNSLFIWRLIFGVVIFAGFLVITGVAFVALGDRLYSGNSLGGILLTGLWVVFLYGLWMITIGYVSLFLNDFIVPLMYKYRIPATEAWHKFMPLLKAHFWYFVLYGIFIFFLSVVVVITVMLAGLLTCCIGLLLLIIPYINAVVLLPVSVTYRSLSLYFLEQFGAEYRLFEEIAAVPETPEGDNSGHA